MTHTKVINGKVVKISKGSYKQGWGYCTEDSNGYVWGASSMKQIVKMLSK